MLCSGGTDIVVAQFDLLNCFVFLPNQKKGFEFDKGSATDILGSILFQWSVVYAKFFFLETVAFLTGCVPLMASCVSNF